MDVLAAVEKLGKRFEKWRVASPLLLAGIATLLCSPLLLAVVWWGTHAWQHHRIAQAVLRENIQIERQLNNTEGDLEAAFGQARNLGDWISEEGHARQAILSPSEVPATNRFLRKLAGSFGVDLIYVMNAKGISVASSNADTRDSIVGVDFSDRTHFKMAMRGVPGNQFAMGRTTNRPGFFFSMPVRDGKRIAGIVGIKLDQMRLLYLTRIGDTMVADDYGVVVLTDNPEYMFDVLPGRNSVNKLSRAQLRDRYARDQFTALPLRSAGVTGQPNIMLLGGRPVLVGSRTIADAGLTLYVTADFDVLRYAQRQSGVFFAACALGLCGLVWSLWVGLFYFLYAHDYRRQLELANVRLSDLNRELNDQVAHDFLTGCLNRRAFSTLLQAELERVNRYGGDLSLCMIDIDHFKRVNDSRGHEVGDIVLKFLVDALQRQKRRTDILARYGGEEFVLLMPNTSASEAVLVIDRMRQTISEQALPEQVPELKLTFSAGVVGWHPDMTELTFVNASDQAMYAAKSHGRNRVVLGQP